MEFKTVLYWRATIYKTKKSQTTLFYSPLNNLMSSPVNFPYVITSKMSNSKIIIEQLLDTVESLVNQDNERYKQIRIAVLS